jgi:hypothetical protein
MRWRGYKSISQIKGWRRSPLRKGIHYTFLFLFAAKIAGCTPVPPKVIDVSKDQNFRPATPADVQNIEQAIAAVITVAKDSGYPSMGLSLWIYSSTESFTYWGRRRADPTKVPAFTNGSNIHVDLEALRGRPWGSLVGLLAHEYGHVLHNSLSDYSVRVPHWFAEGFAEWMSSRILDSLSWQGADLVLRRAKLEIGAHPKFNLQVFHNKETWDSIVTNEPFGWT